ncbi:MAG: RNA polymerase sigma-70 factor [Chitinophagaceae bacterium]
MIDPRLHTLCLKITENDDQGAFGELFAQYYPSLLPFAVSILKNHELGEEVVEDVFMKLWQNRKMLNAINNINYYLLVAVKHTALDYLNKEKRTQHVSLENVELEFGDVELNPENALISRESILVIQKIIESLPDKCKLIFRLVKENGLKYREVAELLNISIKTVETQMTIALSRVGSALENQRITENDASFKKRKEL